MTWLSYRIYRFFSFCRYWAARRLTPAGFLVLGGAFLSLGLTMDTEHSAAYQVFGITMALLVTAFLWAPLFRGRFAVERHLPRFATVDQTISYDISVQNLMPKATREVALIEDLADARMSWAEFRKQGHWRLVSSREKRRGPASREPRVRAAAVSLAPRSAAEVRCHLTPSKRGVLRFTGVTFGKPDPLGIFRGFVRVAAPQSLLVLPKRYPLPHFPFPGLTRYQRGGVALAGSVGESEEFVSLREYRRGDPLRHIHWKSSAKASELIVKEFQDEFFVRHALILDTFASDAHQEQFEEAVSIAASFASTIEKHESLLDLMFVGPQAFCFTAGRGVAHAEQMLEILAAVQLCQDKPFSSLQELVVRHSSSLSGCICVLLDWDEARQQLVRQLQQLGLPVTVLVVREADATAELDRGPMKSDPGSFHVLRTGQVAEGLQRIK